MHQNLNYFSQFHKSNLDRTIVSKITVLLPNIQKSISFTKPHVHKMENILPVPRQCQHNKGKNLRAAAGDRLTVPLEQNLPARSFFKLCSVFQANH